MKCEFSSVERAGTAIFFIAIIFSLTALSGCTPSFNWREVSFSQADASGLMPCKPERASRVQNLGGVSVPMHLAACETAGAMFALALLEIPATASAEQRSAVFLSLKTSSKATHSRSLSAGALIAQANIYGQAKEGKDGPGAFSAEAVQTFLSSLRLAGAQGG